MPVFALGLGLGLSGCSQISALAPVGGDAIAEVRYGAIDVLLANDVAILEAPTCTATTPDPSSAATPAATSTEAPGTAVSCTGTTTTGEAISVTSSTAADALLDVRVGDRSLYSGSLQSVIDQAARP